MLTLAQCEKAVTISEPMGRSPWCAEVFMGSKIQQHFRKMLQGRPIPAVSETSPLATFCPVFNGLRGGAALKWGRLSNTPQYLQNRAFVLLRDEWFGPSFVTIMPTGVWVCSF